jgi:flagellar assembly protein FliH
MMQTFEKLLADLENTRHDVFKANEEFILRIVYRLVKHVLLRELKEDTEYVKRLMLQLLDRLGTKENIKIFIGEAEFSSAEALKDTLAQTSGQLKNVNIERDHNISGRGCRVETEFGDIDAQIEVQLQNVAQALGVDTQKA